MTASYCAVRVVDRKCEWESAGQLAAGDGGGAS